MAGRFPGKTGKDRRTREDRTHPGDDRFISPGGPDPRAGGSDSEASQLGTGRTGMRRLHPGKDI